MTIESFNELCLQLFDAMQDLNLMRVDHGDIKGDNIMICNKTRRIKIIDFDNCSFIPAGGNRTNICNADNLSRITKHLILMQYAIKCEKIPCRPARYGEYHDQKSYNDHNKEYKALKRAITNAKSTKDHDVSRLKAEEFWHPDLPDRIREKLIIIIQADSLGFSDSEAAQEIGEDFFDTSSLQCERQMLPKAKKSLANMPDGLRDQWGRSTGAGLHGPDSMLG